MSLTLQPLSIEDGEDVYTMLQHIDAVANGGVIEKEDLGRYYVRIRP